MGRQSDRRVCNELAEQWAHERFIDRAIQLHLAHLAGAQLTPEEEALSWTGEGLVQAADARRSA
jgi:hypothetical protein